MNILMIVIECVAAYFCMILLTFYFLVRHRFLEDRYDRFNQTIAAIFWPAAGPVAVVYFIFSKIADFAEYRRDKHG